MLVPMEVLDRCGAPYADTNLPMLCFENDWRNAMMPTVFVLSGSSGRTANQLLQAALAQFPGCQVELVTESQVRTIERAAHLVDKASKRSALICHSLVEPSVRQAVETEALRLAVPCIDISYKAT